MKSQTADIIHKKKIQCSDSEFYFHTFYIDKPFQVVVVFQVYQLTRAPEPNFNKLMHFSILMIKKVAFLFFCKL